MVPARVAPQDRLSRHGRPARRMRLCPLRRPRATRGHASAARAPMLKWLLVARNAPHSQHLRPQGTRRCLATRCCPAVRSRRSRAPRCPCHRRQRWHWQLPLGPCNRPSRPRWGGGEGARGGASAPVATPRCRAASGEYKGPRTSVARAAGRPWPPAAPRLPRPARSVCVCAPHVRRALSRRAHSPVRFAAPMVKEEASV